MKPENTGTFGYIENWLARKKKCRRGETEGHRSGGGIRGIKKAASVPTWRSKPVADV